MGSQNDEQVENGRYQYLGWKILGFGFNAKANGEGDEGCNGSWRCSKDVVFGCLGFTLLLVSSE